MPALLKALDLESNDIRQKSCRSYPTSVVIPEETTEQKVLDMAKRRVNGRFPVCVWHSSKRLSSIWIGANLVTIKGNTFA